MTKPKSKAARQRIRLRPLLRKDSGLLYEWITDRELGILNSAFYPVTEADHDSWIAAMMKRRTDSVFFVIENLRTKKAIGTCQLHKISMVHRSAELQIRIGGSAHRGKGLGSEAVRLLTAFGFRDLNLHRISLHVFASNERAVRAYKKCGFATEGLLREAAFIDGRFVDVLVMGLLFNE